MKLLPLTPASPAYAVLDDALGAAPAYGPNYYAPVIVTGLPGYGAYAVPLYLTVSAGGLGFFDLDGYALGGTTGLPGSVAATVEFEGTSPAFYYAALALARALPSRLTYSATVAALGAGVFEDIPAPTYASGSLYVVAPPFTAVPYGNGGRGLTFYFNGAVSGYPSLRSPALSPYLTRAAAVPSLNATGA